MSARTRRKWAGELFIGVGFFVVAVVLAVQFRKALKEYRQRAPIRREVQAHPETFRTGVVVRIRRTSGESTLRGTLFLIVRGGFLEISHPVRLVAVLFGQEFYFRASDLRIETYWDQRERISITDISYGMDASLSVTSRTNLGEIWYALVAAGAVPAGQAPQVEAATKPRPSDQP
jgi:hypothetical protein